VQVLLDEGDLALELEAGCAFLGQLELQTSHGDAELLD